MAFDLNSFVNRYNGGSWIYPGQSSAQCWSLYAFYCKELGYQPAYCTQTGYVNDIWNYKATNGTLRYFLVANNLHAGDVVVWNKHVQYPHVAIYLYTKDGKDYYLTQNTTPFVTNIQELRHNFVGILRPNQIIDYTAPADTDPTPTPPEGGEGEEYPYYHGKHKKTRHKDYGSLLYLRRRRGY